MSIHPPNPLVLAVDDEPANLLVIEAALAPLGFDVLAAPDAATARRETQATRPDVVLLDVMMPRESGIEACRSWRASRAWDEVPIVLLTALSAEEHRVAGLGAGADDFLEKPIDPDALERTARRWAATGRSVGPLPLDGDEGEQLADAMERAARPRRSSVAGTDSRAVTDPSEYRTP
jgi:DNA-binding response OmpR family regulator